MKRIFILLCVATLQFFPNGIFRCPTAQAQELVIVLWYHKPQIENNQHRMPSAPISVAQSNHVFTFPDYLAGEIVEFLSGDTVVYTSVIGEDGTVVIPDNIEGVFELVLYIGDKKYNADVEL